MTPAGVAYATSAELDRAVDELTRGAAGWAGRDTSSRIELLRRTRTTVAAAAGAWARAAIAAKGTPPGPPEGEEWLTGPYAVLSWLNSVVDALEKIAAGRSPLDGLKTGQAAGRTTFKVLPADAYEWVLFNGFSAELWMKPGVSAEEARRNAGLGAVAEGHDGGAGLVLGAGNISAIGPLDALYELVAHNRASVLKLNPTFGTLKAAYDHAFAPLVDAGLLRVVNGGAEEGAYLAGHDGIGHVHITGSAVTHDRIVWGSTTDKTERKLHKPITSELGGVSPIIVIPGSWSPADLRFQAEHVATQRLHNAGHNCIAGQLLIVSADWPQKDAFLDAVRDVLRAASPRPAWYPGSEEKLAAAAAAYPDAEHLNGRLFVEVDATTSQDLLATEYFAPVLGHTAIPGEGAAFFARAVAFANDRLDGTLGASVIVAPPDRNAIADFDDTLAALRYGTIAVNAWSAMGFLLPAAAWGAFPGNTLDAVGSGIGIVHNSHLAADVERTVVRGPFRPFPRCLLHGEVALSPKPPWFVTARTARSTAERLTSFAAEPAWSKLPGIVAQALRG